MSEKFAKEVYVTILLVNNIVKKVQQINITIFNFKYKLYDIIIRGTK